MLGEMLNNNIAKSCWKNSIQPTTGHHDNKKETGEEKKNQRKVRPLG